MPSGRRGQMGSAREAKRRRSCPQMSSSTSPTSPVDDGMWRTSGRSSIAARSIRNRIIAPWMGPLAAVVSGSGSSLWASTLPPSSSAYRLLARHGLELGARRVDDLEVGGTCCSGPRLVLDLHEDAEVELVPGRGRLARQVGLVLTVTRVEEARDLHVVEQLAELHRLPFVDLEGVLGIRVAAREEQPGCQGANEHHDGAKTRSGSGGAHHGGGSLCHRHPCASGTSPGTRQASIRVSRGQCRTAPVPIPYPRAPLGGRG